MVKNKYLILLLGSMWVVFNIYFLPFFAWTTGIVRPWLILNGYIPYRDFTWIRAPLDLYILSNWYRVFGVNADSYRLFICFILLLITTIVFFITYNILPKLKFLPFLFFIIFLFPLFQNTEVGEILIGFWGILLLTIIFIYLDKIDNRLLFLGGLVSGLSVITKQNSGAVIPAILIIIFIDQYLRKQALSKWIKPLIHYIFGVFIPVFSFVGYLIYNQSLNDFIFFSKEIVLGSYKNAPLPQNYSLGDGLWIEIGYFVLLIPFLLFSKETKLSLQKIILLPLFVISLFPSLLPSFLSYRAFTAYPIISIVAGYDMLILINNLKKKNRILKISIILSSFIIFILFILRFINPYLMPFTNGEVFPNNYIKDYGESELKTAEWIKKNTKSNEKIISYTSDIVYLLSNRLPENKYIDFQPFTLFPTNSAKAFITKPPRTFAIDKTILDTYPDLKKWPFIDYLYKNYSLKAKFNYIEIYQFNKK